MRNLILKAMLARTRHVLGTYYPHSEKSKSEQGPTCEQKVKGLQSGAPGGGRGGVFRVDRIMAHGQKKPTEPTRAAGGTAPGGAGGSAPFGVFANFK